MTERLGRLLATIRNPVLDLPMKFEALASALEELDERTRGEAADSLWDDVRAWLMNTAWQNGWNETAEIATTEKAFDYVAALFEKRKPPAEKRGEAPDPLPEVLPVGTRMHDADPLEGEGRLADNRRVYVVKVPGGSSSFHHSRVDWAHYRRTHSQSPSREGEASPWFDGFRAWATGPNAMHRSTYQLTVPMALEVLERIGRVEAAEERAALAEQREREARATAEQWRNEANDNADAIERNRQEREKFRRERDEAQARVAVLERQAAARSTIPMANELEGIYDRARQAQLDNGRSPATAVSAAREAVFVEGLRSGLGSRGKPHKCSACGKAAKINVTNDAVWITAHDCTYRESTPSAPTPAVVDSPRFKTGDRVESVAQRDCVTGTVKWCGTGDGACVGVEDDADGSEWDFDVGAVRLIKDSPPPDSAGEVAPPRPDPGGSGLPRRHHAKG